MSTQILIVPADLRYAASTCWAAGTSLNKVRLGLAADPPLLPADVAGRLAAELGRTWLDISEQLAYVAAEAGTLKRRAELAEQGDEGTNILNELALGRVPTLGGRFEMPKPEKKKKKKKGFWDKGVPGFVAGMGINLWDTVYGVGELVSLQWRPGARHEFGVGIWYAIQHPDKTWDAFFADVTAAKYREAGENTKATGYISIELISLGFPPLKALKLRPLAKAANAAKASRDAAVSRSAFAEARALAAQRRLDAGPRWDKWDALSTDKEVGSWRDPVEFHVTVVNPADQAAVAAGRDAAAAQVAYDAARKKYELWNGRLETGKKVYDAADRAALLERIIDDLNKHHAQEPPDGHGSGGGGRGGSW